MPYRNSLTRTKKQKAMALLQVGQLMEAKMQFEQICKSDARDAEAWAALGAIHLTLGSLQDAERCCRRAIEIRPDYAEANYLLGNTYRERGQHENAVVHYRLALKANPQYGATHCNLGAALETLGDFAAAADHYWQALQLDPQSAGLHYNLGNALRGQDRFQEAAECYRRATQFDPGCVEAYNNLGIVLSAQGRTDEAIGCYRHALHLRPDYAEAHNNLGNLLEEMDKPDLAIVHYRRALEIQPDYAEACHNLGNALADQYKLEEAIACYQRAIEIDPDYVEAICNLGVAFGRKGSRDPAIACYRRVLQIKPDPDAHFNLALIYLLTGNFRDGWQEYAWHWLREGAGGRPFPPAAWDGSDLGGRPVFLHGEQGLGDELFFLRFVPWLKQRGAGRIVYRPAPKIASLLARVSVIDRLAAPGQAPAADDMVFAIGDLPRLLGMERPDQIPPPLSLVPLPQQLAAMRHRLAELGPPPYVGVTWRAGMPDKELVLYKDSPLAGIAGVLKDVPGTILILQRLPQAGEVETFSKALGRPAHDLSALNEDLEQMLALLALLDDYVGVSNTNMHLRAAVGRTARVLVPAPPEWRWMADGKESPWFPGFTVYRQGYDGEWEGALTQLESDLRDASGHGRR